MFFSPFHLMSSSLLPFSIVLLRCAWTYGTTSPHPSWHALTRTNEPASRRPSPSCTWWCLWSGSTRCPPVLHRRSLRPQTGPACEAGGPSGLSEASDGRALKMPPDMAQNLNLARNISLTTQIQSKHRSWLFSYFSYEIKIIFTKKKQKKTWSLN